MSATNVSDHEESAVPEQPSVLIVDDNDDIRCNARDILEDLGYRTSTAHDGPSALQLVKQNTYDVALLDFKMPGMDGATLCSEIKKLRPEIVAIMVTAHAGSGGVAKAQEAGTWKVLRKPVNFSDLLPLVEQAIHAPLALVVNDNPDSCEHLWQRLRDHDYRVQIAHSETDGLSKAKIAKYDVAIVDLRHGQEDGRRVIAKIRELTPTTRIILATSFPDCLGDTQADVVLTKPVEVQRILDELIRN